MITSLQEQNAIKEQIFETVNTIVDNKIKDLSYDITKICTITDDSEAKYCRYEVKCGSLEMFVVDDSNIPSQYKKGQVVRVTIPNGNYNVKKVIEGLYEAGNYHKSIYANAKNGFIPLSDKINIIKNKTCYLNQANSTNIYNFTSVNLKLSEHPEYFNSMYFKFEAEYPDDYDQIFKKGLYSIEIQLIDTNGKSQSYFYYSHDIIGDPYSNLSMPQDIVWDIADLIDVKNINIKFHTDENFIDKNNDKNLEATIVFKSIEIQFGQKFDGQEGLSLFSLEPLTYDQKNEPRNLQYIWYNTDSNQNFLGFSEYSANSFVNIDLAQYTKEMHYKEIIEQDLLNEMPRDEKGLELALNYKVIEEIVFNIQEKTYIVENQIRNLIQEFKQEYDWDLIDVKLNNANKKNAQKKMLYWQKWINNTIQQIFNPKGERTWNSLLTEGTYIPGFFYILNKHAQETDDHVYFYTEDLLNIPTVYIPRLDNFLLSDNNEKKLMVYTSNAEEQFINPCFDFIISSGTTAIDNSSYRWTYDPNKEAAVLGSIVYNLEGETAEDTYITYKNYEDYLTNFSSSYNVSYATSIYADDVLVAYAQFFKRLKTYLYLRSKDSENDNILNEQFYPQFLSNLDDYWLENHKIIQQRWEDKTKPLGGRKEWGDLITRFEYLIQYIKINFREKIQIYNEIETIINETSGLGNDFWKINYLNPTNYFAGMRQYIKSFPNYYLKALKEESFKKNEAIEYLTDIKNAYDNFKGAYNKYFSSSSEDSSAFIKLITYDNRRRLLLDDDDLSVFRTTFLDQLLIEESQGKKLMQIYQSDLFRDCYGWNNDDSTFAIVNIIDTWVSNEKPLWEFNAIKNNEIAMVLLTYSKEHANKKNILTGENGWIIESVIQPSNIELNTTKLNSVLNPITIHLNNNLLEDKYKLLILTNKNMIFSNEIIFMNKKPVNYLILGDNIKIEYANDTLTYTLDPAQDENIKFNLFYTSNNGNTNLYEFGTPGKYPQLKISYDGLGAAGINLENKITVTLETKQELITGFTIKQNQGFIDTKIFGFSLEIYSDPTTEPEIIPVLFPFTDIAGGRELKLSGTKNLLFENNYWNLDNEDNYILSDLKIIDCEMIFYDKITLLPSKELDTLFYVVANKLFIDESLTYQDLDKYWIFVKINTSVGSYYQPIHYQKIKNNLILENTTVSDNKIVNNVINLSTGVIDFSEAYMTTETQQLQKNSFAKARTNNLHSQPTEKKLQYQGKVHIASEFPYISIESHNEALGSFILDLTSESPLQLFKNNLGIKFYYNGIIEFIKENGENMQFNYTDLIDKLNIGVISNDEIISACIGE